jgi:nicotinate-nucleotide adenylyltransferase
VTGRLRTGVFGGTFDPVHIGHTAIARGSLFAAQLDRVLVVPVGTPAHRATHASAQDRATMLRLALAGEDSRIQFDATALDQTGPVYTADTLALVRAAHPNDVLFFIAGADSLARSVWRRLDEVALAVERFYVVPRRGCDWPDVQAVIAHLAPDLQARFERLDVIAPDVEASEIRARVKAGESINGFVAEPVASYIVERGLYRN